jgi:hypothetical protein
MKIFLCNAVGSEAADAKYADVVKTSEVLAYLDSCRAACSTCRRSADIAASLHQDVSADGQRSPAKYSRSGPCIAAKAGRSCPERVLVV